MLFRVFTIPFDPVTERFDDDPVRDYLSDKDVLSIDHELLMQEGRAYLLVVVRCRGVRSSAASGDAKGDSRRRRDESWRDLLDPKDWPLFGFFASVDHQVLRTLLARVLKDRAVLALLDRIIDHPPPDALPGRGLPIGNLTSQHFANLVLGELDHHVKERMAVPGYIRYMDDFLLFGSDKAMLHELHAEVRRFLSDRLRLELKPSSAPVNPVSEGIGFLGFRVYPRTIRLDQRSRRRFLCKVHGIERAYQSGAIELAELGSRAASLYAHAGHADSWRLRRRVAGHSMIDG